MKIMKQINLINVFTNNNLRCKTCTHNHIVNGWTRYMNEDNAKILNQDYTIYDEDATVCVNWEE